MKKILIAAALLASPAFAQQPAPDTEVKLPLSLVQALVNAGQKAPGEVINPLTEQVRTLVNPQLAPKGNPAGDTQGAPPHHAPPPPEQR